MPGRARFSAFAALFTLILTLIPSAKASPEAIALMSKMPADWTVAAVIVNFQKFDDAVNAMGKKFDAKPAPDMLSGFKKQLGEAAAWVDFSKPVGFAVESLEGDAEPVLWLSVAGAEAKLKSIPDAKEEGGLWSFSLDGAPHFAKPIGDLLIFASNNEWLKKVASGPAKSLSDEIKPRAEILTGRDVFVHFSFEPVRSQALMQIQQISMMAPMMMMGLTSQPGMGDPTMIIGAVNVLLDGVKQLAEQLAYAELFIGLDANTARATLTTGFKDGSIKKYLAENKPAAGNSFVELPDQSFAVAASYSIPGKNSPFLAYVHGQLKKAVETASSMPPASGAPAQDPAAKKAASEKNIAMMIDLYQLIEGMSVTYNFTPSGIKQFGIMSTPDQKQTLELFEKVMATTSSGAFAGSGISYSAPAKLKVGEVEVTKYDAKLDESNPAAATMKTLFGTDSMVALAPQKNRIGYVVGNQQDVEKFFGTPIAKPLSENESVKKAVAMLPPRTNSIVLIDLVTALSGLMPMIGMPAPPPSAAPTAPVALSLSLNGEPLRIDIMAPIDSIAAAIKSANPPPAGGAPGN